VYPPNDDIQLNLMLAEYAQLHAGKLFVAGGGLLALYAVTGNSLHQIAVCGTITLPFAELNLEHTIAIGLFDQDGKSVMVPTPMGDQAFRIEAKLNAALPAPLQRGSALPMPFAVYFGIPIAAGTYYFQVTVDGIERSALRLPLHVLNAPGGMMPGGM
jgi:hypothetical protein